MTIPQLRKRQVTIEEQIDAILGTRDEHTLSGEEWGRIEALQTEDTEVEAQITQLEAEAQQQAQRQAALTQYRDRRASSSNGGHMAMQHPRPAITVAAPNFTLDPRKGYASQRTFLLDVMAAGQTGRENEQLKYLKVKAAAGSDEQSTFADPYGGYLMPVAFSPTFLQIDPEADPVAGRTRMIPMTAPMIAIAARVDKNHTTSVSGGLRVYRRAEADTSPSSRMEMERVELRAHSLFGLSFATEELLADSPISFVALLDAGFRDEFDSTVLNERINGTGVGEYQGILSAPATISVPRAAAGELTYDDVLSMMARVWRFNNAVWLANHETIPQLGRLSLLVGAGGAPIWIQSAVTGLPSTLMGRPLFFTEYVPALGTKGDLMCINWNEYLEGIYQQLQSAESIHVRFVNNERAFRFTMRNAGAPWWRSALTPKNGTNTLSPFVVLD